MFPAPLTEKTCLFSVVYSCLLCKPANTNLTTTIQKVRFSINWEMGYAPWSPSYWHTFFCFWWGNSFWANQSCCLEILLISTLTFLSVCWPREQISRNLNNACLQRAQTPAPPGGQRWAWWVRAGLRVRGSDEEESWSRAPEDVEGSESGWGGSIPARHRRMSRMALVCSWWEEWSEDLCKSSYLSCVSEILLILEPWCGTVVWFSIKWLRKYTLMN